MCRPMRKLLLGYPAPLISHRLLSKYPSTYILHNKIELLSYVTSPVINPGRTDKITIIKGLYGPQMPDLTFDSLDSTVPKSVENKQEITVYSCYSLVLY